MQTPARGLYNRSSMRLYALILVLLLGGVAAAEKVKANQETKLFARPGERAKVLLTLASGKAMTVLAKEGRWLKVRVSGRTGWVARSTVDLPEGDEIARNTRRRAFVDGRGTKRTFGGDAPDDRIGADAVGEGQDDPPSKSKDDEEEEDEEEEDDPPAKPAAKTAAKTPPAKPAAKPSKPAAKDDEEEEEDDEDDENPLPAAKAGAKVATKTPAKGDDEEEDDDEDGEEDEGDNRKKVSVRGKTTMYSEPDGKSEKVMVATRDTILFPTGEKKGKFTEVENDDGDLGYVLTSDLELDDEVDTPAVGGGGGGSQIDARVRAGVSFVTQGLRTPGGASGPPNNYNISTAAMTLALGGGYYRPMGKRLIVGGETTYDYAKALPGIKVPMDKTTSISVHNLNLRGVIGLDFKKASGMMLLGRLGFRYHSFQVANVQKTAENTALLPSEIVTSPMIGAALAFPRLTNKIGLRFSLDLMPLNFSYTQTKNLEDGKSPAAKGAIVGAGFTYRWKSSIDIQATYDLTYASATFGDKVDTSQRMHPMGGVKRTDMFHAVTAGIVKAF